jgi:hypothetical protein
MISGTVELTFRQTRDHFSGTKVDEYDRAVTSLGLDRDGASILTIQPGSEMYGQVERALARVVSLPLHTVLVEAGDPAPEGKASFSAPYGKVLILLQAEDDFLSALIDDDEERLDEISWIKFQQTDAFEQHPCAREDFLSLNSEFRASQSSRTMSFGQYYHWLRQSSMHFDEQGNIKPETLEKVRVMLDAWKDSAAVNSKDWLCRNLGIHPRHRQPFHDIIDRHGPDAGLADDEDRGHSPGPG